MIQISENASKQIRKLIESENHSENEFLRVQVKQGGCSGFSYKLEFENAKKDNDKLIEANGVKMIIDPKSFIYIVGMTLDFSGGLNGTGFSFSNPNAKSTCGCGSSFSV